MSGEFPKNSEEAKNELAEILNGVTEAAKRKLHNLFGPLEESGISREQMDELQKKLKDVEDPTERARMTYKYYKNHVTNTDLPDEFQDFLNKK